MELERIAVQSRDAYRGAQEPRRFEWRDRWYEVVEIVDRWYEGRMDSTRLPLRYFRVRTSSGELFTLRYHELFAAWALLVPRGETRD